MVAAIWSWRPRGVNDEAAAAARRLVAGVRPDTVHRARALLLASSRLFAYATALGLECRPELLFRPSVIERFLAEALRDAPAGRKATMRANLVHLGRHLQPGAFAQRGASLARPAAKAPYRDEEIAAYLALAAAQPTLARQMALSGLISAGAGAGVIGRELAHLSGRDVALYDGICCVAVSGARARLVPVRRALVAPLLGAAAHAGEGYLIGGESAERHNVTSALLSRTAGGSDLPRIESGRLRSTFLAALLASLGVPELFCAAGITDSKSVFDLVRFLEAPSADAVVARLKDIE